MCGQLAPWLPAGLSRKQKKRSRRSSKSPLSLTSSFQLNRRFKLNTSWDMFLQLFALMNQKANTPQTYVYCEHGINTVSGFYSLEGGSVETISSSRRVRSDSDRTRV
jgi:hypothetical protein